VRGVYAVRRNDGKAKGGREEEKNALGFLREWSG
jgi:hypothetical protein